MKPLLAMLLLVALPAAGQPMPDGEPIEVNNRNVFQPNIRVIKRFSRSDEENRRDEYAVEFNLTHFRGSSSQTFGSGFVGLGGTTFPAPTQLNYDFGFTYADIAVRYRHFLEADPRFGVEGLVGAGYANLSFRVRSTTNSASDSNPSFGATASAGVLMRLGPDTMLQFRGTAFYAPFQDDRVGSAVKFEFVLAQTLAKHVAVRAGFVGWNVQSRRCCGDSSITINAGGPAIGLDALF